MTWRTFANDPFTVAPGVASLGGWDVAAAVVDLDDPVDRRVGDYELLEELGRGGMGVVYRARQQSLDREVAVKLLAGGLWSRPDASARFAAEAASAARMQHPHIVAIHEFGADGGRCFYSMELVSGTDLAAHLRSKGPLPEAEACALVRDLARAVHYAHSLNVLHLDLKPNNVLLQPDGRARIADFGLARPLDRALGDAQDTLAGTPSYMAPEQALLRAAEITRATDVYGLGAILYECLTGRAPFHGETTQDTLRAVAEAPLALPRKLRPTLSRDLEAVCLRCLQRDPQRRYPDAQALAEELSRVLDGNPVQARPMHWRERAWRWLAREPVTLGGLATALLILVAAGAAWMLQFQRNAGIERLARDGFAAAAEALAMPASPRLRLETLQHIVGDEYPYAGLRSPPAQLELLQHLRAAVAQRRGPDDDVARELSLLVARQHLRLDHEAWGAALAQSDRPLAWLLGVHWSARESDEEAHGRAVLDTVRRAAAAPVLSDMELALTANLCGWFPELPDTVQRDARDICAEVFARAREATPRNALFPLLQPEFDLAARERWLDSLSTSRLDDYGPVLYRETLGLIEALAPRLAPADLANGLTPRDVAALASNALLDGTFWQARARVFAPCRALEHDASPSNFAHCRRVLAANDDGWTDRYYTHARRVAEWRLGLAERGEAVPRPLPTLFDSDLRARLKQCCSQRGANPEWVRLRASEGERAAEAWLYREFGEPRESRQLATESNAER